MTRITGWVVAFASVWCAMDVCGGAILTTTCLTFEEDYNFKEDRYDGTWYEIRRLHDPNAPIEEDCVVMNYQLAEKGSFAIRQSYQIGTVGEPIYRSGRAEPKVFQDARVPKFYERFNTTNPADPDISIDIVATDYKSYSIVYSCTSINSTHFVEAAWVLSRQTALAKNVDDLVNLFLEPRFKRPEHKWRATQQTADFCKPSSVEHVATGGASAPCSISFALLSLSYLLVKMFQ